MHTASEEAYAGPLKYPLSSSPGRPSRPGSTMPIELKDEEAEIRAIILELRDEWFTIDISNGLVDGLAEPWTWLPTP